MAQIIQHRRDTKANWEQYDPVLAAGEVAVQTDTYQIKVGDGVKKWSELPFVSFGLLDNPEGYFETLSITGVVYDANNMPTEITFSNGSKALYTYDAATGLLTETDYTKEDGTTVFYKVQYTYDTNNLLTSVTRSYV
ncbi:hypothetical protein [Nitratiruptor sp. SB155-2]|uniref:hyaluronate lyase N-terminal domain-containing protein n=1 Tax=Nitratiruptor sp. (strain SB155-2) TaxID=387092 RepID=UPI0001586F70|nr:hypothetical protein [Nitratiruptor sp. SB155-2]BAF69593.1 hypothetical protein NIS_0479 [Nitratiruptor sp. SB155-2]BAN05355.1 tail fiber protein [Nitratiruptor phage NrS-1]